MFAYIDLRATTSLPTYCAAHTKHFRPGWGEIETSLPFSYDSPAPSSPPMITLSSLDPQIAARSLLKHPFYLAWSKGELTIEDLRVYAKEYFHLVERIPGIVARIKERETDAARREMIAQNEQEEREHIVLWKRFAKSLGVTEVELTAHVASAKTEQAIASLERIAEEGLEEGIVAMYALELELPAIAKTKKEGLCSYYNLASEDALAYFDEHEKEEEHLKVWRGYPVRESAAERASDASVSAQHQVLDAVCEACGISTVCM
ncbi:MAG: iron-containing redox enzyme family protein [Candidatus Peregrinibacteria bacterium]|nr:iron-containing redox enzyme family protein [Candidatus Peregrinibacteria bacterium]